MKKKRRTLTLQELLQSWSWGGMRECRKGISLNTFFSRFERYFQQNPILTVEEEPVIAGSQTKTPKTQSPKMSLTPPSSSQKQIISLQAGPPGFSQSLLRSEKSSKESGK